MGNSKEVRGGLYAQGEPILCSSGNEHPMDMCWTRYPVRTAPPRREGDVTSALASHPQLTADDRCDRCGAQTYIRVTLAAGGELLFCAHHGHAHEDKLREMSLEFQDERSRLAATPATAPDTEK